MSGMGNRGAPGFLFSGMAVVAGILLLAAPAFVPDPKPPIVSLAPLVGILFLAAGVSFAVASVVCSKKK